MFFYYVNCEYENKFKFKIQIHVNKTLFIDDIISDNISPKIIDAAVQDFS